MSLDREIKTFKANLKTLLANKKNRFVLIKDTEIISDFGNYEDALTEGYKKYGNQEFLIKQVLEDEVVNFFTKDFFPA